MNIEFRAWDSLEKRMIRSPYDATFNIVIMLPNAVQIHAKSVEQEFIWGDYTDRRFEIMQFTDMKDKQGTEIYEGDILETILGTGKVINSCASWRVQFEDSTQDEDLGEFLSSDLLVVGNIYEGIRKV